MILKSDIDILFVLLFGGRLIKVYTVNATFDMMFNLTFFRFIYVRFQTIY